MITWANTKNIFTNLIRFFSILIRILIQIKKEGICTALKYQCHYRVFIIDKILEVLARVTTLYITAVIMMSINVSLAIFDKSKYLGAVETAKKFKCTPKQALNCKEFSAGYWQWDHLFLVDSVKQFEWPSVFITVSPCEWTFPQV